MLVSKLKPIARSIYHIVKNIYYRLIFSLPIPIANRFMYIDRDMNWSICIYTADHSLDLQPVANIQNPVISRADIHDVYTGFVADPFMVEFASKWLMFFEIFNQKRQRGEIAVATSPDRLTWTYQQVVLTEEFHLSYPYVFQSAAKWYMIPESCEAGTVRLYQSKNFPHTWELVSELLVGQRFVDASVIDHEGVWWMFVGVERDCRTACDELRLYYADQLEGDWVEHPMSPIVQHNMQISRPAGRMMNINNRLIRFTQDCTTTYGRNVSAIEIVSLTKVDYAEVRINPEHPDLFKLGTLDCNSEGMHHLDLVPLSEDRWIACVDAKG